MSLQYNIGLELAAIPYMIIICVFMQFRYNTKSELNRRFRLLAFVVLATDCMDVLTAVTISYGAVVPRFVNMILNTTYVCLVAMSGDFFLQYVIYAAMEEDSRVYRFFRTCYHFYYLLVFGNMFSGQLFSFDVTGTYVHGPWYIIMFFMPMIYIVDAMIVLVVRRKRFDKKNMFYILTFSILAITGPVIQTFFYPQILMAIYTITLAVIIMLFSLETPDYQQLQQAMSELSKLKAEADATRETAMAANKAKSDFLASMSHELRTPINSVMGMNEMVLRETNEENIREYAMDIRSASQNLLSLINDTLDFSKIEAGKMDLVYANYQLSSILSNVVMMIRPKAEQKNLNFTVDVYENLPRELYGDEMRIRQIFVNVLNNAVKYTSKGSVYFTVRGKKKSDLEMEFIISVTDTGIGIQEEDIPKLFHNFERLDLQKNQKVEGTGLGLAITSRLVEQMNGTISVSSVYGQGSVFTIHLPQKIIDPTPIGDFKTQYRQFLKGEKAYQEKFIAPDACVLVVDDNRMNLRVVQGLLKKTQVRIETAESGRECLSMIVHKHYDIVLLDHLMPEMDGIETLHHAKVLKNSLCKDTPFIALTAHAIQGMREMYLEEGFDDYMSKPVEGEKLEAIILKYIPKEKIASVSDR